MAGFRRGIEAAKQAATRSQGGKFTPSFKWEPEETKYLQFLTSLDEIATVLMHRFIIVGHREDNSEIYENFISRRDPGLDGPDGYDEIIDRFEIQPTQRCIALAVELEPQYTNGPRKKIEGFDLAYRQFERDNETVEVPNVALVIESPHTLFSQVMNLADMGEEISEKVVAIKRSGKGTDTTYTILPVSDAIDFEDALDEFFEEFDFEGWLEELADEERMKEFIGDLPDNAILTKFPKKPKKGAKAEEKPKTSTRTRKAKVEPVDEPSAEEEAHDDPVEPESDTPAEEATTGRRSRKFSELKRDSKR